jgi:hypothetical protein
MFLNIFLAQITTNYEIADHCVTLKKSGTLSQVESLRSMNRSDQLSTTTEHALRNLPRSPSEEIFDRVKKINKKNFYVFVFFINNREQ